MKTFQELLEGIQDPNIFKAFLLAGGPGSGKSYVADKAFGRVDPTKKGSMTGKKGKYDLNTLTSRGLKVVNSDHAFETYLKQEGLSNKMPAEEDKPRGVQFLRGKKVTKAKQDNYLAERLGIVIDMTAGDFQLVKDYKANLEQLGYDCYMIFVNTSVDVALHRNANRPRSVPESLVMDSHKKVQANIGKFSNLFAKNMIIVDNNENNENPFTEVVKHVTALLRKKVRNPIARGWIAQQMKTRGITRLPTSRTDIEHGGGHAAQRRIK